MTQLFSWVAQAQGVPPGQQQQIIQQQEQKQRARERQLRNIAPPASGGGTREDGGRDGLAAGRCIEIDSITIDGAPLLPPEERAKTTKKYRGKCLSLQELNEVLRDVTNWYIDEGFVTTRAYLPEQDLSDGSLTVTVIEGRVASVKLRENGKPRQGANTVLPDETGKRLNIRNVEQGLDQISRLPSFNPKVRLEPAKKDGESDIVVDTERRRSWRLSASYDNFGVPSTGRRQVGATAEVDDLLGLYDFLSVSAGSDAGEDFSDFHDPLRSSQSASIYYAIPYGPWTASFSTNYYEYETPIIAARQTLSSTGNSLNHRFELQRLLQRDQVSKTFVAGAIASKRTRNYIEDALLEVSSRRLTVGSARLSHVRSQWGGVLNLTGIVERGLPILGGLRDDANLFPGTPRAQFTKGTLEASFFKPFELAGQKLLFSTSLVASASPYTLYSTERISAGGRYTVRGFIEDSIVGDIGAYTRNELIWTLPDLGSAELTRILGTVDLFVAYDAGWIKNDKRDPFEGGRVQGIAGGARFSNGAVFGEVTAEHALSAPDFIDPDSYIVGFRVGVTSDAF